MEVSKSRIKLYASLRQKKHRTAEGLFAVEGTKCVEETLSRFRLEALVALPQWLNEHHGLLRGLSEDKIFEANRLRMEQMSSLTTSPDVIAVYHIPQTEVPAPEDIAAELVLMLDGVQDPGNLGTIMRVADWFGIRNIIASPDTVDVYNPKTIQSTMGAIARVKVAYTDLPAFLQAASDIPVYGTLLDGENLYASELSANGILLMGNEGKGISPQVREYVTRRLKIPSFPPDSDTVESLNVAMATAITVAEFRRRRMI